MQDLQYTQTEYISAACFTYCLDACTMKVDKKGESKPIPLLSSWLHAMWHSSQSTWLSEARAGRQCRLPSGMLPHVEQNPAEEGSLFE